MAEEVKQDLQIKLELEVERWSQQVSTATKSLDKLINKIELLGQSTKSTTNDLTRLGRVLRTLTGAKALPQLGAVRRELGKTTSGFKQATTNASQLNSQLRNIPVTKVKRASDSLANANRRFQSTSSSARTASDSVLSFNSALTTLVSSAAVFQSFDLALRFDRVANRMKFATGSLDEFNEYMALSNNTANELGLSLIDTQRGLSTIAASAKGTALEGQPVIDLFNAVSSASGALSLSADETNSVFLAFSQIISKGKVAAEELRGQIGERLPSAFNIASKSLGVTNQELDKMLQDGTVLAEDFLPKFAQGLQEAFGSQSVKNADSLNAEWNILKNNVAEAAASMFRLNGFTAEFLGLFNQLAFNPTNIGVDSQTAREFQNSLKQINQDFTTLNDSYKRGAISAEQYNKSISELAETAKNVGSDNIGRDLLGIPDASQYLKLQDLISDIQSSSAEGITQLSELSKSETDNLTDYARGKIRELDKDRETRLKKYYDDERRRIEANQALREKAILFEFDVRERKAKEAEERSRERVAESIELLSNSLDRLSERREEILENRYLSPEEANQVGLIQSSLSGSQSDVRQNILAQSREIGATRGNIDYAERQLNELEEINSSIQDLNDRIANLETV